MGSDGEGQTLQAIMRASNIIGYIEENGGIGATELSENIDIPKSTAFIYLKTLHECGYLTNSNGQYRLSLKFLEKGARARRELDIYNVAKSEIDQLAENTGEVANLGVMQGGLRVLIYKSEGSEAVYDDALTGNHTYPHWVSLGKAMLSCMSDSHVDEIVDMHGLPQATENTIIEREALKEELDRIADRGYALEDEEHWEKIRAVAVPIIFDSAVQGAISITGPTTRFDENRIEELVDMLYQTKNIIELRLEHY